MKDKITLKLRIRMTGTFQDDNMSRNRILWGAKLMSSHDYVAHVRILCVEQKI